MILGSRTVLQFFLSQFWYNRFWVIANHLHINSQFFFHHAHHNYDKRNCKIVQVLYLFIYLFFLIIDDNIMGKKWKEDPIEVQKSWSSTMIPHSLVRVHIGKMKKRPKVFITIWPNRLKIHFSYNPTKKQFE